MTAVGLDTCGGPEVLHFREWAAQPMEPLSDEAPPRLRIAR